ncbi:DNA gyrase inhibitor YacG [Aliiroseovarius sp. KMU-50]|uniref:DNA gyrase inhibitor YacG n=1 Tax=Aliiroseovarius salicola TaxID=3009082 RepID=A0ABT4W219_9RHOB|nr:DNA gyrase inhibitor YacG [Aliiroseovarius sp. KMU-50]MDA5093798.1 DNA gyrase inhibitor YacG [Aliiroseovarius sp. KMU-50]
MSCPICSKESNQKYRPFCSRRCADVDLGRWLNGSYAVPADAPEDVDEVMEEMAKALSEKSSRPH